MLVFSCMDASRTLIFLCRDVVACLFAGTVGMCLLFFVGKVQIAQGATRKVVGENLFVGVSVVGHDGCANLTKSHSVSPSGTGECKAIGGVLYDEGG